MDGIQVEYFYPALPDVLWRALTERAKIAGWWGDNDFVPETGHRFTVSAIGLAALAGPIQCTVLELEPGRRLAMSWQVGTTRATIALLVEAAGSGSALVVTRRGSVGPAAPADVEQALHHLFSERLWEVVSRAPAEVGASSGAPPLSSLSLWGRPSLSAGPPRPAQPPPPARPPRAPRLRRPQVARPAKVWPAVAIAVVVAVAAFVYLLGALGTGADGSGGALGPFNGGGPGATGPGGNSDPAFPVAGPVPAQAGQPNQSGQPSQPGQPGNPGNQANPLRSRPRCRPGRSRPSGRPPPTRLSSSPTWARPS